MSLIKSLKSYPSINVIFDRIKDIEEAVFLDSSSKGELSKYSIIALRPYLKLVDYGGFFKVNGVKTTGSFSEYVKTYLKINQEDNNTSLPITSGAVGYFSYDFGRKKEGVESENKKTVHIPDSCLYFYDVFIIEDIENEELSIISNGKTGNETVVADEIINIISKIEINEVKLSERVFHSEVFTDFTKDEYKQAVDEMIQYIVDGDIYVVNMTQQIMVKSDCTPYEMFCRLRKNNPSPFGAYLDYGDFQIVCASPERFMQMRSGKVTTRPIKGTRKRGETPEEDQALYDELAVSEKDQSELLMIVDLERNDLNSVCIPGTVKVTELFKVETYATVFHLIANIEGIIKQGCNPMDLIEAVFPGGSITGAPKLRAMELIDKEEKVQRNLYTGSIGYISLNGDCDFNIVIRTAVCKNGEFHIGAGGGITCESELEFEYEETWQKAKALLGALDLNPVKGDEYEYRIR